MEIIIIICLLIGFISWLIYKHEIGKPSHKCSHEWEKIELWKTNVAITHRFTCKKCGIYHNKETWHTSVDYM